MSYIIGTLLYILFGAILAYPYCIVIGWGTYYFVAVALIMPMIFVVGFLIVEDAEIITGITDRGFDEDPFRVDFGAMIGQKQNYLLSNYPAPFPIGFWAYVGYLFCPIAMNWASLMMGILGFEHHAALVYTYRYWPLVCLPILGIVCFGGIMAWDISRSIWIIDLGKSSGTSSNKTKECPAGAPFLFKNALIPFI